MGSVTPAPVSPMLATAGHVPTGDQAGWAFEFKWDGVRAVVSVEPGGGVRAVTRLGHDLVRRYPELEQLPGLVPAPMMLDGELVVLDEKGRPNFRLHQHRMQARSATAALVARYPVQFYAFDVLHVRGEDLLRVPYEHRRERLEELVDVAELPLRVPPAYPGAEFAGRELLEVARETGLEGVVSKRLSSTYVPGRRSTEWIKTPLREKRDVLVCGWKRGSGRFAGTVGGLLVGVRDERDGRLRYVGGVGTGLTDRERAELLTMLIAREQEESPFDEPVPPVDAKGAHWVVPDLVGEVEYREWITPENRLRHPSWRGLRLDVSAYEVTGMFAGR